MSSLRYGHHGVFDASTSNIQVQKFEYLIRVLCIQIFFSNAFFNGNLIGKIKQIIIPMEKIAGFRTKNHGPIT